MAYDWKTTLKKGAIQLAMATGLFVVSFLIEYLTKLSLPTGSVETIYIGIGISILTMIQNYLKHKDDSEAPTVIEVKK